MPAKDHRGPSLPPAEKHPDVRVEAEPGRVRVSAGSPLSVPLNEGETRGLICELSAAYSRAFDTGTGS